jgi:hypothetical protein
LKVDDGGHGPTHPLLLELDELEALAPEEELELDAVPELEAVPEVDEVPELEAVLVLEGLPEDELLAPPPLVPPVSPA